MIDPVIELSLCFALVLLFAAAAWHKVSDRMRFGAVVRAYNLLPSWLVAPATRLLPLLEASIAIGLLYPPTRRAAALAGVPLLVLYTTAISVNLARGRREIDCGCFAASARVPLSNWLVVRNAVLIGAACLLLMPVRARTLVWIDGLTVVTTLITLSLLWAAGQRLAQTGPALRQLGGAR
ncbi:MAG: methylamine utilization protein MauE [Deltaproteobacteria bacterium]|nr:MAG: methylamine utilization protein MauE [Deltaproteobacteria bacterium]